MRQSLGRQVLHIHLPGHYPLPTALDILSADEEIAVLGDRNGGTILRAARSCSQGQAECENCVSSGRVNGRHLSHSSALRFAMRQPHSITSSARSRIDVDTSIPSALAVLRLTIVPNLVDRSTGRSLGFAPFTILSTNVAARRNISGKLIP